jgi:hypothetical protein
MDNKIKKFLKNKEISYHLVKESEFYDFFNKYENSLEIGLTDVNRDHVVAIKDHKVIAAATLFNQENSRMKPIKNTITLSNIYTNKNNRNTGIATNIINVLLEEVKKQNKLLKRTSPDFDGKLYIFDKIEKEAAKKNVLVIPHNLDFIYYRLDTRKEYEKYTDKEKIKKMHEISKEMLEHKRFREWGIEDVNEVNGSFIDVLDEILEKKHKTQFQKKSKLKHK